MKINENSGFLIKFFNCTLLRGHKLVREDLWVRNGVIINPEKVFFDERNVADREINCGGALISPGFIDLQINGGFGIDFSQNATVEQVNLVSKGLLAHGVTAFCPTLVTSPADVYKKVLPNVRKREGGAVGAAVLGAHVEGPFINPEKKGAHPPEFMRDFNQGIKSVEEVYGSLDNIAIITIAPEMCRAQEVIEELSHRGIVVSLGHSAASLDEGERAITCGASLITHLFNAMLPFHHRDPGLVGLLASESVPESKTVYYGIIADGVHTHPAALRIAYRTDPKGLVLVTDAVSALGFKEGRHRIGQMEVEIRGGRALVAGTNTLCGSIATMNESVRFFKAATGCSTVVALEAATLHPAQALSIAGRKGVLDFGADADFVFLDDDLKLLSTWIAGECVFTVSQPS